MSGLELKRPTSDEEKEELENIKENAEEVVVTDFDDGSGPKKFFTDLVNEWNEGWIEFAPDATESHIVTSNSLVKMPPQNVKFVDPPIGAGIDLGGLGVVAGAAAIHQAARQLRRSISQTSSQSFKNQSKCSECNTR